MRVNRIWLALPLLAAFLLALGALAPLSFADTDENPAAPSRAAAPISAAYTVSVARAADGVFEVTAVFTGLLKAKESQRLGDGPLTFHMPVWSPGTYTRSDYGKNVSAFKLADAEGNEIAAEHPATDTWRATPKALTDRLTLTYSVARFNDWAGGGLRAGRGDFLGTSIFIYIKNFLDAPATVAFSNLPETWRVFTAMPFSKDTGLYSAKDYDELADCPFALGAFESASFAVEGKTIEIVAVCDAETGRKCREALRGPTEKIVKAASQLMGGLPFERYVFLYFIRTMGFGGAGLEHATSTQIWATSADILGSRERLNGVLSVTAHEFFHLWNVKRIRAAPINPYNYQELPKLDCLWFHEGCTSYYQTVTMARAGLYSKDEFLGHMARLLAGINRTNDYYARGECFGFLLDCLIRHHTGNRKSFDDVVRALWKMYGQTGKPFNQTAEIMRLANEIAGADLSYVFEKYILGKDQTPVAELLAKAGLKFEARGGREVAYLGVQADRAEGGIRISAVTPGSPAEAGGMKAGDLVLELNGKAIEQGWNRQVQALPVRTDVPVKVKRGEETLTLTIKTGAIMQGTGQIVPPTAEQKLPSAIVDGIYNGLSRIPEDGVEDF